MPRPRHEPDEKNRRTVEAMVGYGIPHEAISRVIGITPKTLRRYYRAEIETGATKANARVAESLFQQATGAPAVYDAHGNVVRAEQPRIPSAAIWWSKARMGWRETVVNENVGKDGGPQEHDHKVSLASLSDDVLDKLAEISAALGVGD